VFRGISDFGDPKSKDGLGSQREDRKIWQELAALAAASAAVNFCQHDYREQDAGQA
jgi:hypothetical protein